MPLGIYSGLSASDEAKPATILHSGTYGAGIGTTFSEVIRAHDIACVSFINITNSSEMSWLSILDASDNPIAGLKWLHGEIGASLDLAIIAVLYHPSVALSEAQYKTTVRGFYPQFDVPGAPTYLPEALMYSGAYAGSAVEYFKGGWAGSSPAAPTGPAIYTFQKHPSSTDRVVVSKLHLQAHYDGEDTHSPLSDMINLGWNSGGPVSYENLGKYLSKRLPDFGDDPVASFRPSLADNRKSGTLHIKQSTAVKLHMELSEKSVAHPVSGLYSFTPAIAPALVSAVSDYPSALSGAPDWPNGTKESHALTINASSLAPGTAYALTVAALDAGQKAFAGSLGFTLDNGSDVPELAVSITDGVSGIDLRADAMTPLIGWAQCTLTVEVKTEYPGTSQPTGRVVGPAGFGAAGSLELAFTDHAVLALPLGSPLAPGAYTVIIDRYVNNAGISVGPFSRSFVMEDGASPYVALNGQIEGWSYYPREEGLPDAFMDPTDGPGISWEADADNAAISAPATGSPLAMSLATGANCVYRRQYASAYDSAGAAPETPNLPGTAKAYLEACLQASYGAMGGGLDAYTADGQACQIRDSGVGLELVNGMYKAALRLVETRPDASAPWSMCLGLDLGLSADGRRRWALSSVVDWSQATIIRLSFKKSGSNRLCVLSCKSATSPLSALVDVLSVNLADLPLPGSSHSLADMDTASVAFGVWSSGGAGSCGWEYVRYGFLDDSLALATGSDKALGVFKAQADGDSFFRSPDILIGDPASLDAGSRQPNIDGTASWARVRLSADAANAVILPYKLRLFAMDWDESDPAQTAGFFVAGFKKYKDLEGSARVFTPLGVQSGTIAPGDAMALPSGGIDWTFDLKAANLNRRYVLFCAVDSPVCGEPLLLPETSLSDLLQLDPATPGTRRDDCRYAARQFLPDFYVRGYHGDDGSGGGSGWLSPDMAMGVFLGSTGITADNPHTLRAAPPDPKAIDTVNNSYPSGFALGEPYEPGTKTPAEFAYSPGAPLEVSACGAAASVKLTDTGWSDVGSQCYYNRMWVRLSNRGVVPGPAKVQVFFLGAQMRAMFDAVTARDGAYQKIISDQHSFTDSSLAYIQDRFQLYNPDGSIQPALVRAIPAASGMSSPGMSPTLAPRFAVAEFLWHVCQGQVPASSDESHSCRAACINLPKPSTASPFPGSTEAWSSGIDEGPLLATPAPAGQDIWGVNALSNNIAVRNSNIVQGTPPPAGEVNPKIAVVDDEPTGHRRLPNTFIQTFGKEGARWAVAVDAKRFSEGQLVLRMALPSGHKVALLGAREIKRDEQKQPLAELGKGQKPGLKPSPMEFRFFLIPPGGKAAISGIPAKLVAAGRQGSVALYFQLLPRAKAGIYPVTISQTADGKTVGGYTTYIQVLGKGEARYVADARTGIIYDAKRDAHALQAIPYERMAVFSSHELAMQDGFVLNPTDALRLITGKLPYERVNLPRKVAWPSVPETLPAFQGGLAGAIVGTVLDGNGKPLAGLDISLRYDGCAESIQAKTDQLGRYLFRIKADKGVIPVGRIRAKRNAVSLSVRAMKGELRFRLPLRSGDLCASLPPIRLKI